jgi:uncharacterized membrane protein
MTGAPTELAMTDAEAGAEAAPVRFDAVLYPHTSLSPRGFLLFMAVLGSVSFAMGVAFMLAGAWPVFGFFGLDVLIVWLAFRASYRAARRSERLVLTDDALTVERISPRGARRSWRFQPYWLSVVFDDNGRPGTPLLLRSHGKALEIGAFLAPHEKRALSETLRAELRRLREGPAA